MRGGEAALWDAALAAPVLAVERALNLLARGPLRALEKSPLDTLAAVDTVLVAPLLRAEPVALAADIPVLATALPVRMVTLAAVRRAAVVTLPTAMTGAATTCATKWTS